MRTRPRVRLVWRSCIRSTKSLLLKSVLALTAHSYLRATLEVIGDAGNVLAFPPLWAGALQADFFTGYDVIYLDLHGFTDSIYLYFDREGQQGALNVNTLKDAKLGDVVVFSTACNFTKTAFPQAFYDAGAQAVIGGEGLNYAGKTRIAGAQQLAKFLIKRLNAGEMPARALANAKMNLRFTPAALLRRPEGIDALDFEILRRQ